MGDIPGDKQKKPNPDLLGDKAADSTERTAKPAGADAPTRQKLLDGSLGKPGEKASSGKASPEKAEARTDKTEAGKTESKAEPSKTEADKPKTNKDKAEAEKKSKEMLQDLAERLKMSGTFVFRDKNENLHQANVNFGFVMTDNGKIAGRISPKGQVDFNEEGQAAFNVGPKLDIQTTADAFFHNDDPAKGDIVGDARVRHGNQNWSGIFVGLRNEPKYKCLSGNIFDMNDKFIGALNKEDKIDLAQSNHINAETKDINTILGEGLTFIGKGKNEGGEEYPFHFTVASNLHSGTWKIPRNPGQPNPKYEDYTIRLGMVFDAKDNMRAYFISPRLNADGMLEEEGQILRKRPGANGPQLPVINGLADMKDLESVPPSFFQNSLFTVQLHGETGFNAAATEVFCLGSKHQADGKYAQGQGYVSIAYMKKTIATKEKTAWSETSVLTELNSSNVNYKARTGEYAEGIKEQEKILTETNQQRQFLEQIQSGKVNGQRVADLQRIFRDLQATNMGKLQQIDQRPERITALSEQDLSNTNGRITTIDLEKDKAETERKAQWFASAKYAEWKAAHPFATPGAEAESSIKPIKEYTVRAGKLYDDKDKYQGQLTYSEDDKLAIKNEAGKLTEITDPSLNRSYWQLEVKDAKQPNGTGKIELTSLDGEVIDLADRIKRGGETYAEAIRAANKNPEDIAAQETAKYAQGHFRGTYTEGINHLRNSLLYGAYSKQDQDFIRKGPSEIICRRMVQAKEAPKIIEKPTINTEEIALTVNGLVRHGHDIYTIKNGDLELEGKKVGKFKPGYVLEFAIANQDNPNESLKKYVDLNKANRLLLDITIGSDAQSKSKHHKFLGLGPGTGGLLYVDEFKQQINAQLDTAKKSKNSYTDSSSDFILAVSDFVSGGRSQQINDSVVLAASAQKKFNDTLDNIFTAFTADKIDNSQLNQTVILAQTFSRAARISAEDATTLAESGQQLKADIQSGLEIAAIQSAVTIGTGGMGLVAGSTRIANLGLGGRLVVQTAKILSTPIGKMVTAVGVGVITSAVVRHTKATSKEQDMLNAVSGGIEGLANLGGAGALGKLGKEASLLKRLAAKGLALAGEGKGAARGAFLYSVAGNIRTGEEITAEGLLTNTLTEFLGDRMGARAVANMAEHRIASKLVESIISNLGDGTTGSWAEATKELREAKGNNYTALDLMRRMLEKGAWSSFLPASAVASHATGKVQNKQNETAAKQEGLREKRREIENSQLTPAQQLAKKHVEFTGAELAAALKDEAATTTNAGTQTPTVNANNGHEAPPQDNSVKTGLRGLAMNSSIEPSTLTDNPEEIESSKTATNSSPEIELSTLANNNPTESEPNNLARNTSPEIELSKITADNPDKAKEVEEQPVPKGHQRFYYVQQPNDAQINQAPLNASERARLNKLLNYAERQENSKQEANELQALQNRLAITPLNDTEKTRLAQLQKAMKNAETIGIETFRELQSLSNREQISNAQVIVFNESALPLAQKAAGNDGKIMVVNIAKKQLKQNGVVQEAGLALLENLELVRGAREHSPTIQSANGQIQQQGPVTPIANVANNSIESKAIFNELFDERDFEAAEEYAKSNLAPDADITNASQREQAAWALAAMGKAQYMQGGESNLKEAESALQTALLLTSEPGRELSPEESETREYLIATQLAQGKLVPQAANAIVAAWVEGRSAFDSLVEYNRVQIAQGQNITYIARSDANEAYLPDISLVRANDSETPSNNNSTPLTNSVAYAKPSIPSADKSLPDSAKNEQDNLNSADLNRPGTRIGENFPAILPDVQFVNQEEGQIDFSPTGDIAAQETGDTNRARVNDQLADAKSNRQRLQQQYLNLQDQIGTLQATSDATQTARREVALQLLVSSQSWGNTLRARLALINNELVKETERRQAESKEKSQRTQAMTRRQREQSALERQLDDPFFAEFQKLLDAAQAQSINEQEEVYGLLKERGIEIPNPPVSQLPSMNTTPQARGTTSGASAARVTPANISNNQTNTTAPKPKTQSDRETIRPTAPISNKDIPSTFDDFNLTDLAAQVNFQTEQQQFAGPVDRDKPNGIEPSVDVKELSKDKATSGNLNDRPWARNEVLSEIEDAECKEQAHLLLPVIEKLTDKRFVQSMLDLAQFAQTVRDQSQRAIGYIQDQLGANVPIRLDSNNLLITDDFSTSDNGAVKMACDNFNAARARYNQTAKNSEISNVEKQLNQLFDQVNQSRNLSAATWTIDCLGTTLLPGGYSIGTQDIHIYRQYFTNIMAAQTPEDAIRIALSLIAEENEHYLQGLGIAALGVQEVATQRGSNELTLTDIPEICRTYERLTNTSLEQLYPMAPNREAREQLFANFAQQAINSRKGQLLNSEEQAFNNRMIASFQHLPYLHELKAKLLNGQHLFNQFLNGIKSVGYLAGLNHVLADPTQYKKMLGEELFRALEQKAHEIPTALSNEQSALQVWQSFRETWVQTLIAIDAEYQTEYASLPHEIYAKAWAVRVAEHGVELLRVGSPAESIKPDKSSIHIIAPPGPGGPFKNMRPMSSDDELRPGQALSSNEPIIRKLSSETIAQMVKTNGELSRASQYELKPFREELAALQRNTVLASTLYRRKIRKLNEQIKQLESKPAELKASTDRLYSERLAAGKAGECITIGLTGDIPIAGHFRSHHAMIKVLRDGSYALTDGKDGQPSSHSYFLPYQNTQPARLAKPNEYGIYVKRIDAQGLISYETVSSTIPTILRPGDKFCLGYNPTGEFGDLAAEQEITVPEATSKNDRVGNVEAYRPTPIEPEFISAIADSLMPVCKQIAQPDFRKGMAEILDTEALANEQLKLIGKLVGKELNFYYQVRLGKYADHTDTKVREAVVKLDEYLHIRRQQIADIKQPSLEQATREALQQINKGLPHAAVYIETLNNAWSEAHYDNGTGLIQLNNLLFKGRNALLSEAEFLLYLGKSIAHENDHFRRDCSRIACFIDHAIGNLTDGKPLTEAELAAVANLYKSVMDASLSADFAQRVKASRTDKPISDDERKLLLMNDSESIKASLRVKQLNQEDQFISNSVNLINAQGVKPAINYLIDNFGLNTMLELVRGNEFMEGLLANRDIFGDEITLSKEARANLMDFLKSLSKKNEFEFQQAHLDYRTHPTEDSAHLVGGLVKAEMRRRLGDSLPNEGIAPEAPSTNPEKPTSIVPPDPNKGPFRYMGPVSPDDELRPGQALPAGDNVSKDASKEQSAGAEKENSRPPRYEAPVKLDWDEGTPPEYIAQELLPMVNNFCILGLAEKAARLNELANAPATAEYKSLKRQIESYADRIEDVLNEAICDNENEYPPQKVEFDSNLPDETHGESSVDDVKLYLNPKMFRFGQTDVVINTIVHENKHHQRKTLILSNLIEEKCKKGPLNSKAVEAIIREYKKAFILDNQSDHQPLKDLIQTVYDIRKDKPLTEKEKQKANELFESLKNGVKAQPRYEDNKFVFRYLQDTLHELENNTENSGELLDAIYAATRTNDQDAIKDLFGTTTIPNSIKKLIDLRQQAYTNQTLEEWDAKQSDTARQILIDTINRSLSRLDKKLSEGHKIYENALAEVDAREAGDRAGRVGVKFVAENKTLRLIRQLKTLSGRKSQNELITKIADLIATHELRYVLDEFDTTSNANEQRHFGRLKNRILAEASSEIITKTSTAKMSAEKNADDDPEPLKRVKEVKPAEAPPVSNVDLHRPGLHGMTPDHPEGSRIAGTYEPKMVENESSVLDTLIQAEHSTGRTAGLSKFALSTQDSTLAEKAVLAIVQGLDSASLTILSNLAYSDTYAAMPAMNSAVIFYQENGAALYARSLMVVSRARFANGEISQLVQTGRANISDVLTSPTWRSQDAVDALMTDLEQHPQLKVQLCETVIDVEDGSGKWSIPSISDATRLEALRHLEAIESASEQSIMPKVDGLPDTIHRLLPVIRQLHKPEFAKKVDNLKDKLITLSSANKQTLDFLNNQLKLSNEHALSQKDLAKKTKMRARLHDQPELLGRYEQYLKEKIRRQKTDRALQSILQREAAQIETILNDALMIKNNCPPMKVAFADVLPGEGLYSIKENKCDISSMFDESDDQIYDSILHESLHQLRSNLMLRRLMQLEAKKGTLENDLIERVRADFMEWGDEPAAELLKAALSLHRVSPLTTESADYKTARDAKMADRLIQSTKEWINSEAAQTSYYLDVADLALYMLRDEDGPATIIDRLIDMKEVFCKAYFGTDEIPEPVKTLMESRTQSKNTGSDWDRNAARAILEDEIGKNKDALNLLADRHYDRHYQEYRDAFHEREAWAFGRRAVVYAKLDKVIYAAKSANVERTDAVPSTIAAAPRKSSLTQPEADPSHVVREVQDNEIPNALMPPDATPASGVDLLRPGLHGMTPDHPEGPRIAGPYVPPDPSKRNNMGPMSPDEEFGNRDAAMPREEQSTPSQTPKEQEVDVKALVRDGKYDELAQFVKGTVNGDLAKEAILAIVDAGKFKVLLSAYAETDIPQELTNILVDNNRIADLTRADVARVVTERSVANLALQQWADSEPMQLDLLLARAELIRATSDAVFEALVAKKRLKELKPDQLRVLVTDARRKTISLSDIADFNGKQFSAIFSAAEKLNYIENIIPESIRQAMVDGQIRDLIDFAESSERPGITFKLIADEVQRGATAAQLTSNRLSMIEELSSYIPYQSEGMNSVLALESKSLADLEKLTNFIMDGDIVARAKLVAQEAKRASLAEQTVDTKYLESLETLIKHIPYDSETMQKILKLSAWTNTPASSEWQLVDGILDLIAFVKTNSIERRSLVEEEIARSDRSLSILLEYSRLSNLEKLRKCFVNEPNVITRILELENGSNPQDNFLGVLAVFSSVDSTRAALLAQEIKRGATIEELSAEKLQGKFDSFQLQTYFADKPEVVSALLQLAENLTINLKSLTEFVAVDVKSRSNLITEEIENGATAATLNTDRLSALLVLRTVFADRPALLQAILEFEKTSELRLTNLAKFLNRDTDARSILIAEEINRGATAERLSASRLSALLTLQTYFPEESSVMKAARETEAAGRLYLEDLALILRPKEGAAITQARVALIERAVERGEQLNPGRLEVLAQLDTYFSADSRTMQLILERESSSDLDIYDLAEFITESDKPVLRRQKAGLLGQEMRRGATKEQFDKYRLEDLENLCLVFPYQSPIIQTLLRLESTDGLSLSEINMQVSDGTTGKRTRREALIERELTQGTTTYKLTKSRLDALEKLEDNFDAEPAIMDAILAREESGLSLSRLSKFIEAGKDIENRKQLAREHILSDATNKQLNALYAQIVDQHSDQVYITRLMADPAFKSLPFEYQTALCRLPEEHIVLSQDGKYKDFTAPQGVSSEIFANTEKLSVCLRAWQICPSMPQDLAVRVGEMAPLERLAASAAYRYATKEATDISTKKFDSTKFQAVYDSQFQLWQEQITQGRLKRNEALNSIWAEFKPLSKEISEQFGDIGRYTDNDISKRTFLKLVTDEFFGQTAFKDHPEASEALASALMVTHNYQENVLTVLQTIKAGEFPKLLVALYEKGARNLITDSKALAMVLTFGSKWPDWLSSQINGQGRTLGEATWPPDSLTYSNPDANQFRHMTKFGNWLLQNKQSKAEHLKDVARFWFTLSEDQQRLPCAKLRPICLAKMYPGYKNETFASEAANWNIDAIDYHEFEKLWLDSQNTPSPFPMETDDGKPIEWKRGKLTGRFIPRSDPRGLFLGHYTNSCQHPKGVGASSARHGQSSSYGGFFVVEDDKKNIVAMSWAWVSPMNGLCFDNCESKGLGARQNDVARIYQSAADDLTENFGFHTVTMGTKMSKLKLWRWDRTKKHAQKLPSSQDIDDAYYAESEIYTDAETQVLLAHNSNVKPQRRTKVKVKEAPTAAEPPDAMAISHPDTSTTHDMTPGLPDNY